MCGCLPKHVVFSRVSPSPSTNLPQSGRRLWKKRKRSSVLTRTGFFRSLTITLAHLQTSTGAVLIPILGRSSSPFIFRQSPRNAMGKPLPLLPRKREFPSALRPTPIRGALPKQLASVFHRVSRRKEPLPSILIARRSHSPAEGILPKRN